MKSLFIFFMLLGAFISNAQSTGGNPKIKEDFTSLKLQKYPLANFPDNASPVSDIKIIQFLSDSMRMGYSYKGNNASVTTLRVTKPLTGFLQDLIYRMYKDDFKKTGIKILWVLKDFRLAEKGTEKTYYEYTNILADAYVSKDGVLYTKALSIDTVIINSGTSNFEKIYSADFESMFRMLSKSTLLIADSVLTKSLEAITFEQIIKLNVPKELPPILKDNFYVDGIYTAFNQFLQNKPSIENYSVSETTKNSLKFIDSITKIEIDSIKIWGICKQGLIYKYDDGDLVPIEKQGKQFIISDFVENTNKYNAVRVYNANARQAPLFMYFAPASILVINPLRFLRKRKYDEPLLVKEVPGIVEKSMLPLAFGINMKTGEFSF